MFGQESHVARRARPRPAVVASELSTELALVGEDSVLSSVFGRLQAISNQRGSGGGATLAGV